MESDPGFQAALSEARSGFSEGGVPSKALSDNFALRTPYCEHFDVLPYIDALLTP